MIDVHSLKVATACKLHDSYVILIFIDPMARYSDLTMEQLIKLFHKKLSFFNDYFSGSSQKDSAGYEVDSFGLSSDNLYSDRLMTVVVLLKVHILRSSNISDSREVVATDGYMVIAFKSLAMANLIVLLLHTISISEIMTLYAWNMFVLFKRKRA